MPLPDERPRQSVANLIGRFEKQTSSTSSSAPPIAFPRNSSVTGHRADDSTQEEIKEKREWPPKGSSISSSIQTLEKRLSSAPSMPPSNREKPALPNERVGPPTMPQSVSAPNLPTQTPQTIVMDKPEAETELTPDHTKAVASRTSAPVQQPVAKTTVGTVSDKSTRSTHSTSSTSTPLKPQHTGQSSVSTQTTIRNTAKPKTPAAPKGSAVATPTRAKMPQTTTPSKTPSTTPNTKTPVSIPRPKTPSGLYAQTAASLARSKVGPPVSPPPEKPKRKITTDLSKPTAASASKTRSPAVVPPNKVGKPVAGKPTPTKTLDSQTSSKVKSPVKRPITSTRRPEENAAVGGGKREVKVLGAESVAAVDATHLTDIPAEDAEQVDRLSQQGDRGTQNVVDSTHNDTIATGELDGQLGDDHVEDDEVVENYDEDFPEDASHGGNTEVETGNMTATDVDDLASANEPHKEDNTGSTIPPHFGNGDAPPVLDPQPSSHGDIDEVSSKPDNVDASSKSDTPVGNGNSGDQPEEVSKPGTDLEDIVNLLESGPNIQRRSVDLLPSGGTVLEAGEIPDED